MQNCDRCILWNKKKFQNWSRVVSGQTAEPEGTIEPSDVVVVGNLAA